MKRQLKVIGLVGAHLIVFGLISLFSDICFDTNKAIFALALASTLMWISVWDFLEFRIPDLANLFLILLALSHTLWHSIELFPFHVFGAVFWFLFLYLVIKIYRYLRGFDGLGLGDAKMMAGVGALLGPTDPLSVVLIASVSGLIYGLFSRWLGSDQDSTLGHSAIAFGPFLSVSTWSVWLFGAVV